jgi:hypothetical protein
MQLLIQSTASAIIRRINFPKRLAGRMTRGQSQRASLRPLLSEHDEQDARQTVALVLCQVGLPAPTHAAIARAERIATLCPLFARSRCERASYISAARTLGLDRWKACFRAVRGALRIDRRVREDATDFAQIEAQTDQDADISPRVPEVLIRLEHATETEQRRAKLARRTRYAHSLLHAAFAADKSRKRRATFRTHLSTLRAFAAIWGGRFASRPLCEGKSDDALHAVLCRFRQYLTKGETALTAATMDGVAEARRATAFCNERGELKTLAGL